MHPELKDYLDKLYARTMARYNVLDRQLELQEAILSKSITGASTPQPARSAVVASDGGLIIDATAVAVIPDASSSTTKTQEVLELIPDASLDSIDLVPTTCSTDGLNQVVTTAVIQEVCDAPTTVYPEPVIDLVNKEVEQLTPVITTDVDPKFDVEEREALRPVEATADALSQRSFLVTSEVYHVVDPSDLAAPTLAMCPTNCSRHDTNLLRYVLHPAVTPSWLVLRPKPWPSFWRDQADGNEKRTMPWPSLACSHELYQKHVGLLSQVTSIMKHFSGDLNLLRESLRCLRSVQPHGVHCSGLVLLLFRDEDFIPISCCELIPLEEAFSLQVVELWLYIPDGPRLLLWPPTNPENFGNRVVKKKLGNGGYTVQTTVKAMKLQPAERLCFLLPPAKPPDYQPRIWSKLQEQILHTQLQNLIVALVELQPWPSWMFQFPILSVMTSTLKECDCQHLLSAEACNLDKGCHKCHIFLREIDSKLLLPSGVQCEQPTSYSEFGSAQAYLKLHEVCAATLYLFENYLNMWSELPIGELPTDCYYSAIRNIGSPVPISVDDSGSVKLIEHRFLVVHQQVRQWAWCFCKEELWSIKYLACKIQEQGKFYEHHILEYVVGGILIPDKLQETVHIMTVSIQSNFLSQDGFKWTGRSAGGCISFALGRVALTSFPIDSSKCSSKQFGNQWQAYTPAYLKSDDACTAVVHKFKKIASEDWGLMLYFDQRPRGVYGMANSSTVDLCIPGILVCIPAIIVDASVQHLVIPTYASIQINGAQCKYVCTNPCLFGKWFVESGSTKNDKVIWQTSMEYFWRECVIGALTMPFLFSLMSNLCLAGGVIFTSCDSFNSLRNGDQLNSRESTTATYILALTTSIQFMFSVGVERSGPLCDNVHSSSDQGAGNGTDTRKVLLTAPYDGWPTRCLKFVIEGPSESLRVFQLKPPWHHYVLDCTVRKLLVVARISTRSVLFNSMEAKAWAFAKVWNCKNCQLELLRYNKVHQSFDAIMLQGQEMELCTTVVDLLLLPNQRWYSLCCDCPCDLTNASVVVWVEYPADEVRKSLNPTMTAPDLQQPKILIAWVISKKAQTMSRMTSYTCYHQDPFQEGRGVTIVAAVFAQDFVGLEYYSSFGYHRNSDHFQEHRVNWDPGGWQWCRLEDKPSFKKGGMLGASCNLLVHGLGPSTSTWAGPGCVPPRAMMTTSTNI